MKVICLIATLILSSFLVASAADVKDELRGVKKEIQEKKQLLKKTTKVEKKVSGELIQIDKSLQEKQASLTLLTRDLKVVENSLSSTLDEIDVVKTDVERKRTEIHKRLVSLYKAGEIGNVRIFYSSESFPQMVENLRYMKSVLENDKKLFADYNARIDVLKKLKVKLESDAQRKERIKVGIQQKKQEIEDEKKKKTVYLSQVRDDKKSYLASLRELQANARRLQSMVEKLEAISRKRYTQKNEQHPRKGSASPSIAVPDKGLGAQRGRLSLPVRGELIGSFGRHKHPEFNSYTVSNGISIAAPAGADIHAIYDGTVIFANYFKGYGNMVIVDHGGGFFSLYAHASRIAKKVGAEVSKNEVLASVGDVDSTRGPMLYLEIRYQGKPVDPSSWFR